MDFVPICWCSVVDFVELPLQVEIGLCCTVASHSNRQYSLNTVHVTLNPSGKGMRLVSNETVPRSLIYKYIPIYGPHRNLRITARLHGHYTKKQIKQSQARQQP